MTSDAGQTDRSASTQKPWRIELHLVGARRHVADVEEELRHLTDVANNAGFLVELASVEPLPASDVIDGSPLAELLRES